MALEKLIFEHVSSNLQDRFGRVAALQITGAGSGVTAFIYECRLNLDKDGSPTTYGWDNPLGLNTAGSRTLQLNLKPRESWHTGAKGVSSSASQKAGLGNACGDPGDGTKGWFNFLNTNTHNFRWSGLYAVTKKEARARNLIIDIRPELEARAQLGKSTLLPAGDGSFPVVQGENAPAKGYYVSATSTATDGTLDLGDPNRYVNGDDVPYTVWANEWQRLKINGASVALGDFGFAINRETGASSGFLFGDGGTPYKVGESSPSLYDALGGSDQVPITFIAFPGSGSGRVVGKNPKVLIELVVRLKLISFSLAPNATELPTRIAMGLHLAIPKQAEMTDIQAARYSKIMASLKQWAPLPWKL